MWMLRNDPKRCCACKHAALCLTKGQMHFLACLYICRQCSTILLGSRIHITLDYPGGRGSHTVLGHNSSAGYVATSLPCCVDPRTVSTWGEAWGEDHLVRASQCPVCRATALNEALHELKESKEWTQWKEALQKQEIKIPKW